jgi:uncharacterized protein YjbI with pentapeptide repeats
MANADHLERLRQGVDAWNDWRAKEPTVRPDLSDADLGGANLRDVDLREANLSRAKLTEANLSRAKLRRAYLAGAWVERANLTSAELWLARLEEAYLKGTDLRGADLVGATFWRAHLGSVDLSGANARQADFTMAYLGDKAHLTAANLFEANLTEACLVGADLRGANLTKANLVEADFEDADLTGCRIYGISAWGLKTNANTNQQNLVITPENEPEIMTDRIEVAQFVYLLLHNEKIRDVIDTIGRKGVLLLGRFTGGRITVLERLRNELRKRGFLPMVFNFDKPETRDFTETIRLLAGLSHFVIADITNPRSAPLELQATVPEYMIPFVPIIEEGEEPFAMLKDLWLKHRDWVFEPIYYSSLDRLADALDSEIIEPAEARFAELLARRAEEMKGKHI